MPVSQKLREDILGKNMGWVKWYAWHPVSIKKKIVWLEDVWRREKYKRTLASEILDLKTMRLEGYDYITDATIMERKLKGTL